MKKKGAKNKSTFLGQALIDATEDAIAWHKEEKIESKKRVAKQRARTSKEDV